VTIQVVSLAADLAIPVAAGGAFGLAAAAVATAARGRTRLALVLVSAMAAVVLGYGTLLVGVGLASRPQQLAAGDAKCFDDWCAALVGARQDAATGTWLVDVQVQNRARRQAMRSNLARAYLEVPGRGRVAPVDGSGLQTFLQQGGHADVQLTFATLPGARNVRFVVVEGVGGLGFGAIEIGGEGSPFHERAGWPLS
jgi:hypothetical protein